ncbi:hypothetical protein E4T44_03357 [Aureobasidium sp. EXF-8845]|nr:hypothetical protein E4T44_03357 [Aureobasidium sp. EXF-8845]KAI4855274.1 hypothetical protein E4T45_03293 [Aureobasidium sp. EXF-8846]
MRLRIKHSTSPAAMVDLFMHSAAGHPLTRLPSGPATKFRLLDLPNEIIREICIRPEFRRKDLHALRLTSKLLCGFTSRLFAKKYFKAVTVFMSRHSLRAFIELAQHPYFGSVVELVNISPICDGSSNILFGTDELIEVVEASLTRFRKDRGPITDGRVERMLSVAFKAFADRGQCLRLVISTLGARNLVRDRTIDKYLSWHLDWKTTIEQTVKAVTLQGCKITEFSVDKRGRGESKNKSGLCTDDIEQELSCLCSNVATLQFAFGNNDFESTSKSVKRMVSAAKDLKFLKLVWSDQWDPILEASLQEILTAVASTSLSLSHFTSSRYRSQIYSNSSTDTKVLCEDWTCRTAVSSQEVACLW